MNIPYLYLQLLTFTDFFASVTAACLYLHRDVHWCWWDTVACNLAAIINVNCSAHSHITWHHPEFGKAFLKVFILSLLCCEKHRDSFLFIWNGVILSGLLELKICLDILRVSCDVNGGRWKKRPSYQTVLTAAGATNLLLRNALWEWEETNMLRLQSLSRSAFNFYNIVLCVLFLWRLCNRCTFRCSSNFTWFCLEGSVWVHNAIRTLAE